MHFEHLCILDLYFLIQLCIITIMRFGHYAFCKLCILKLCILKIMHFDTIMHFIIMHYEIMHFATHAFFL